MLIKILQYCLTSLLSIILSFTIVNSQTIENRGEADFILGTWVFPNVDGKITITKRNNVYFGKITQLRDYDRGVISRDTLNPDKGLRARTCLGIEILTDLVYVGNQKWAKGRIYDPESGNSYDCSISITRDPRTIQVRGFIGISLIGRSQLWKRE